jgi:enamine deaminase RidA (YjgF/YER057c/UK114 family)
LASSFRCRQPFGIYAEAVQTGNLLFLTGMLPTVGREAKFVGRVGAELDVEAGRAASRLAALNGLAVAKQHLGSLDKVKRIVRLGVAVATSGDVREQPKVADGASELLQDVFGKDKNPPTRVWRSQPSARHQRRVGNHFRVSGVRQLGRRPKMQRGQEGIQRARVTTPTDISSRLKHDQPWNGSACLQLPHGRSS